MEDLYLEEDFNNSWEDSCFTEYSTIENLWEEYEAYVEREFLKLEEEIEEFYRNFS